MYNIGSEFRGPGLFVGGRKHDALAGSFMPVPLVEYYNFTNLPDDVRHLEAATGPWIPSADASRAVTVIECYRQQRDVFGQPLDIDDLSYLACVLHPSAQFPHQTPVICPIPPETFTVHDEFHLDSVGTVAKYHKN